MSDYWPMDDRYIEKIKKRKNVVMKEFPVAGVSRHQDLFPKNGFLNDDYFLPDDQLMEKGIRQYSIPKYGFDNLDLSIEHDLYNKYDPNAIKVFLGGEHVGFIRAEDAEYVLNLMFIDAIADVDGRIVGGPAKQYNPEKGRIEEVDYNFGIRLYLFIRKDWAVNTYSV